MSTNKTYTAEDISRYLDGGMSAAEMHALEKEALNDPFLADAIEGMRGYDKVKFAADTDDLRKQLDEKVRSRKRVLVLPILWKVAAVLLIVITGVAIIIYTGEKNEVASTELARTEQSKPAPQKTDTSAAAASVMVSPDTIRPQARKKMQPPAVPESDDTIAPLLHDQALAVETPSPVSVDSAVAKPKEEREVVAEALSGRVAGVDVRQAKRSKSDTPGNPQLSELSEVVVVGYGTAKNRFKSSTASTSLQKRIQPEIGWFAFENYINTNKNRSLIDSSRTETEKLSFVIDSAGRPSAFKILSSLSKAHDEEVIRLLNEGPDWQVLRGKKRKVTLSIIF